MYWGSVVNVLLADIMENGKASSSEKRNLRASQLEFCLGEKIMTKDRVLSDFLVKITYISSRLRQGFSFSCCC
jgi:hypothetical protein